MELEDCAFPLLAGITITDDPAIAFRDVDAAILVGSRPRSKGMERKDLLAANAGIFKVQGRALNESARRDARVIVVGKPANTNAAVLARYAPDFPAENITSMIRLDHNRAVSQLAAKVEFGVDEIERVAVWGNHSSTMFADWRFATAEATTAGSRWEFYRTAATIFLKASSVAFPSPAPRVVISGLRTCLSTNLRVA